MLKSEAALAALAEEKLIQDTLIAESIMWAAEDAAAERYPDAEDWRTTWPPTLENRRTLDHVITCGGGAIVSLTHKARVRREAVPPQVEEKTNMSVPKQLTFLAGLRAFIALSLAIVFCPGSHAAEMRLLVRGNDYRSLIIEGEIESGDYEHFLKVVKDNQGKLADVYLLSPGGDFVEAMKIGRAMRALELGSMVPGRNSAGQPVCYDDDVPRNPSNCTAASAAFFIHVGAVDRYGLY